MFAKVIQNVITYFYGDMGESDDQNNYFFNLVISQIFQTNL